MRPSFLIRSFVTLAVAGAAIITNAPNADAADPPINVEVVVIHATKCDKKTVDPGITDPPPSMGYDCLALVSKKVVSLSLGTPNTTPLPNGRTFQLIHTERVVIPETKVVRFKLRTSINSADGAGFTKLADITADPNKPTTVGGWMHLAGRIFVTIKLL